MIYAAVRAVVLLCVITSSPAAAFQASLSGRPAIAQRASAVVLAETVTDSVPGAVVEDCGCAEEAGGVLMNDVRVTGRTLRDTVLADVNGGRSSVGEVIGADGKAVVVFLRHLGWPLCWDYALNWQREASRLSQAGVAGPLFISVGQPEQLQQFLEINPELKDAKALIDDSADFLGYKSVGFNMMIGDKKLETPPDFKPPTMGMGKWVSYMRNVASLSPIPKDMKFGEVPQGVRVLGGTYAIDGDEVVFSHMDEVPGATPEIAAVLKTVGA